MDNNISVNTCSDSVYSDIPERYAQAVVWLGENIRAARVAAGLTQVQLSEATGISQSDISKFERTGRLSTEQLQLIATACRVSASAIFATEATFSPLPAPSLPPLTPRAMEKLRTRGTAKQVEAFLLLNDRSRRGVVEIVLGLLAERGREAVDEPQTELMAAGSTRAARGRRR